MALPSDKNSALVQEGIDLVKREPSRQRRWVGGHGLPIRVATFGVPEKGDVLFAMLSQAPKMMSRQRALRM